MPEGTLWGKGSKSDDNLKAPPEGLELRSELAGLRGALGDSGLEGPGQWGRGRHRLLHKELTERQYEEWSGLQATSPTLQQKTRE